MFHPMDDTDRIVRLSSVPAYLSSEVCGHTRQARAVWLFPLLLLYVIGGTIQYLGLLTPTECNAITLLFFCMLLHRRSFWRVARYELPVAGLLVYFVISGMVRGTDVSATAVYVYYSACLMLAAPAGRLLGEELAGRGRVRMVQGVITGGLLVELSVTALQHLYPLVIATHSAVQIGAEDAVFGTLPLGSDVVLAGCGLLAALAYAHTTVHFGRVVTIACMALGVVFLGHSKAMQGAATILVPAMLGAYLYGHTKMHRYRALMLASGVVAAPVVLFASWYLLRTAAIDFMATAASQYSDRANWVSAGRLAPYGQLLHEGTLPLLFGHGALTYYNPISKHWLYNAGFSTVYELSVDFGLTALLIYVLYQAKTILSFPLRLFPKFFIIAIWATFIFFNDVLANVAFVFGLNITISFVAHKVLHKTKQCNHL